MKTTTKFIAAALIGLGGYVYYPSKPYVKQKEGITDAVVKAVIQIESNGNPNAQRYEAHINDTSYGLMQILTRTAKELERKHSELPRLGTTQEEIKNSLLNPKTNVLYGKQLLEDNLEINGTVELAVAAYNAGPLTPRNARVQQELNELYGTSLTLDGNLGRESQAVIKRFQQEYNQSHKEKTLSVDGRLGPSTYEALQKVWAEKNPGKENPKGIIPVNKYTPNHIRKFEEELARINHN